MKKIISIILSLLMMIGAIFLPTTSKATFTVEKADLHSKGTYVDYIHFGKIGIVCDYVVYEKGGKEYPAYCLNKDLKGVSSGFSYSVSIEKLLTDVRVWRTIINGYPYKTYQELGCANKEEAFVATKQAIYCAIYEDREPEFYVADGEISTRVKNAITKIVADARASTEVKQNANLTIQDVTRNWKQDSIDSKYISKTYTVKANSTINTYLVKLENMGVDGARIVDENNNEKTNFKYGENFKIIMPIKNMQTGGQFNIKVSGKVLTKPILYGYAPSSNLQDYAIAGEMYEEGTGTKTINYNKNETKIIVIKKDEAGNPLEGVKFRLLNANKEIIHTELVTNNEGKIIIENLEPGLYYLEETSTLNGYAKYEEPIEANITYNEELTIKVTNSKETVKVEKPEITESEKEVISETPVITENEKEVVVKLPRTGM